MSPKRGHHLGDPLVLGEDLIVQFLQERHLVINGYLVPRCLYAIEIVRMLSSVKLIGAVFADPVAIRAAVRAAFSISSKLTFST